MEYVVFFKANKPQCENFNATEPKTWMILLDAKFLYGGVMRKNVPIGNFSKTTDSLVIVLATADVVEFGLIWMLLIWKIQQNYLINTLIIPWEHSI